jgi:periplasmic divalent cation tolerance protein
VTPAGPLLVLSTVASAEDAERIAAALVEGELAACVSILPSVRSIYRWKGTLEREEERLLLIKTRGERFDDLRRALVAIHPYEVPEVVALPIADGHAPYLEWLARGSGAGSDGTRSVTIEAGDEDGVEGKR